jgi:hypothetical protein
MQQYSSSKHLHADAATLGKHVRLLTLQMVSNGDTCFRCHVCMGQGSKYEKQLYALLNQEVVVVAYAVEAAAMPTVGL